MHNVEMDEVTPEFSECWRDAGRYLQSQAKEIKLHWLKAELEPPFLEHLSFRIGNRLFFVGLEDIEGRVRGPGNTDGYKIIANKCNGYACLMLMQKGRDHWIPVNSDWGLIDPDSKSMIDPAILVSDEKIEMTDWELQDFAVQVVRNYVENKMSYQVMSSQGNPSVDPSMWFIGDHGPEWIVIRACRYPDIQAEIPKNLAEITSRLGSKGYFASVGFANVDDAFDPSGSVPPLPLWRGHGFHVRFKGLDLVAKH